jgi:hypothetical protein
LNVVWERPTAPPFRRAASEPMGVFGIAEILRTERMGCRTITNHDDEFWRDELIDSASVIGVAASGAILATAS